MALGVVDWKGLDCIREEWIQLERMTLGKKALEQVRLAQCSSTNR